MRCVNPIQLANKAIVPCGKCPNCLQSRAYAWAFRLMVEERLSDSSHFITLTYNDSNLVYTDSERPTLCKYHLQCFFKRLRYYCPRARIKYYAVGEYGSKTFRPHYHAIIFNATEDAIELAWNNVPFGQIYFGDVSIASVGYTLKYLTKQKEKIKWFSDERLPEFSCMSKGLGIGYLTPNIVEWHVADMHNRKYVEFDNGVKISMPRYYADKLYTPYEKELFRLGGELIRQADFFEQFSQLDYHVNSLATSQLTYKRVKALYRSKFSEQDFSLF